MAAPIFVAAAVVAARAAMRRTSPRRRAVARVHHVGLIAWVKRWLRRAARRQRDEA